MSADANRTTEYQYTLDGQLAVLIARNDVTGDQVTRWIYGTTLEESGVASNSLLRAKIYPDSDDNAPGFNGADTVYDRVEYRYNRLGQLIEQKDQNETVHAYDYDRLGRLTQDRVTALGTGIDGAVRRVSRGYDRAGRLESVTSWSEPVVGAGTALNQVQMRYNGFGQLISNYQSHDGPVATGSTPVVRYTYADGSNRHIRRLSTVYPDGRELALYYGEPGSDDDKLGRVQEIRDGGAEGTPLARYTRRGLSATMRIEYPQCGGETPVEMSYIKQPGEPDGPAGDQYTGQDQFNRIIDVRWLKRGTDPVESLDRFQYGFDRAGNRTYRRNVPGSAARYDELYDYDGLYQLDELRRGTLTEPGTGIDDLRAQEDFTFDPTGSWDRYQLATPDPVLDQRRQHNRANELTAIDGGELTVAYDRAGNMTRMPSVENWTVWQTARWDAWNRLVAVEEGDTALSRYRYDGLTRRLTKVTTIEDTPQTGHFYYSDEWQIIEQRVDESSTMERHFVWGIRYPDDLVLRDRKLGGETEHLYATHDQWHVTAVADPNAAVKERYAYNAFGYSIVTASDFTLRHDSTYGWESRYGVYRWDSETSLYLVRNRPLHPSIGKWLSRDPADEIDGANLYRYVNNRVTAGVDPLGLVLSVNDGRDLGFFVDIANSLCPDASWVSSGGGINPADPNFCCTAAKSSHPSLCQCLCSATTSDMTYTLYHHGDPPGPTLTPYERKGGVTTPDWMNVYVGPGRHPGYVGYYPKPTKPPFLGNPNRVPANPTIITAHELCGHAVPQQGHPPKGDPRRYTTADPVIQMENRFRIELGPRYGRRTQ